MPSKDELQEFNEYKEKVRKLIGAAILDFVTYFNSIKDPIIVGGQYSNDKLLTVFNDWLSTRNFSIKDCAPSTHKWLDMCHSGLFTGQEVVIPPKPSKPKLPKPPTPTTPPHIDDPTPDDGYYNGNDWKPDAERPKSWTDEGEDWKGEDHKDGDQGEGFDNGFQPT